LADWVFLLFPHAIYAPRPAQTEHASLSISFAMQLDLAVPVWLLARGTSMLPGWLPGCKIKIEPVGTEPQIGMVLVFRQGAKLYYHRVIERIGRNQWRTKGDALIDSDEPVSDDDIIGRVTAVRRGNRLREVRPDRAAARLSDQLGRFFGRFAQSSWKPKRLALRVAYLAVLCSAWPFRQLLAGRGHNLNAVTVI
jgi:hypothetical protein